MGREVKRVALDFKWPENKVWEGFLNPYYKHSHKCIHCDGSGESPEAKALVAKWYGYVPFKPEDRGSVPFTTEHPAIRSRAERNINSAPEFYGKGELAIQREARRLAELFNGKWCHHLNEEDVKTLVDAGRLMDFTHTFISGEGWKKKDDFVMPTPQQVNDWSIDGMGHDSCNLWAIMKAECARTNVPTACAHCEGEGSHWESPEYEKLAEDWTPVEPPAGEGYQIWETVSEGSPISPVFATPEELARWMTGRAWGADKGSSYDTWLKFIRGPGWAPSLVIDSHGMRSGPEAICEA